MDGSLTYRRAEDKKAGTRQYTLLALTLNGADRNYFIPDEMGSTLFLLDQNHEIQKTYRYDAFGNILKETGDISNRLAYTGQVYDGETGQYYLRARFYNPKIGRFTQEDIYRGDGLNLYAYCANNPVMYYDPSGYIGICPIGKNNPTNPYEVHNPLSKRKLRKIYRKWVASGMDPQEAVDYLTNLGKRPDVKYLPYIDQYTAQAYQDILSKGDAALTQRQLDVLKTEPYLRDAFIGSEIDKTFKDYVEQGGNIPEGIYEIVRVGKEGADLYFTINGQRTNWWIDITTQKQANAHFNKYGGNGYITPYR